MFRLGNKENEYMLCPYNKAHNIRAARMQVHLVKCRKNHSSAEVETCPFNVTHVINKVEIETHCKICPDRLGFELFRYEETPDNHHEMASSNLDSNNTSTQTITNDVEESPDPWDDVEVPTYNPALYAEKAQVLREPRGLTPSQRRQFRAEERKRLLALRK